MTTKRDEILAVAINNGWREEMYEYRYLHLIRQPTPEAPLGGPRLKMEIRFTSAAFDRVGFVLIGVGNVSHNLYGGQKAIEKHLIENGNGGR